MPHCILEYSDNVIDKPYLDQLLKQINTALASTELFNPDDIKSRVIEHATYCVGDGAPDRTFVTVNLQILSGRDDETKVMLSEMLLEILKQAYEQTLLTTKCSISVQISEIHRASYRREISY